ncbi:MAG: PQQ-binding-like beta-propeller repeat protein [Anaerolineales bacterium]|nr:PQQ-binding-like beta-propeller repeat protein [Anaerolineales bacterium]
MARGDGQHLAAGVTLANRYLIQEIVGVGGMGAVYRARDLHFPKMVKLVAVKEMVNQARDPLVRKTIVQNFEREANVLATLHHPAIPRIFDYFTQDERSYLVMEFIKGKNLEQVINEQEGFISEETVIRWAIELCDVLAYMHNHQPDAIIFRDMKPSNIMLGQHDNIVLVDFGIARPFQTGQRGTQVGTEGYSPPEQYRGDATPVADVYALGATLHHLLTKRDPRLEAPFSFAERPIRKINPNISVELETIVNTALNYNPSERLKDAATMKESIIAVAQRTGVLGRNILAPVAASIPDVAGVKPLWVFTCEDEIRGSPTLYKGNLFVGCYDNNLYCLNATNGEFQWKFASRGGIVSKPAVLDDTVYVGSEDGNVYAVAIRSGKPNWQYATEGPVRSSPRIAQSHVFVGSDDGHMHAVNMLNARRAWKMDAGGAVRSTPFIMNDYLYFGTEEGDFYALDFGGSTKWKFKTKRAITSSPVIQGGLVFFTSVDWTLYALDASQGWVQWRFRMGKPSISTPALVDRFLIVGAVDGFIYCVDEANGKELWRFRTEGQVTGSPVIYKDSVYCGSVDGQMYCLEYKTGRLRWKFGTDKPITGTPVVFDDVLYFGSTDHRVYALLT